MKRVLLTTIQKPLGVVSETCTENIQAEMYHAQVTLAQGLFSIRSVCTGWGLDFIAANIEAPTTVLHYPTESRFRRELRKGYDYVGIGFVVCTFPKAMELCRIVREESPTTEIILGGYGTVLEECDEYADHVVDFLERSAPELVVGRLVAETDPKYLLAPQWSRNKQAAVERIVHRFEERESWQGRLFIGE